METKKLSKQEQLARLTASRELCEQLVAAGVIPWAVLWHMVGDDGTENAIPEWEVGWSAFDDDGAGDYSPHLCIPAWTKEELDVMLGPLVRLPQIADPKMIGRLGNPKLHVWYGANSRVDSVKGADCSARVLLMAIKQGGVTVEDANKRFLDVFQLVENGLIDLAKHPPIKL